MSTVKFECPSCGQNMECDRARSGDVIHCVGCCAELRIPFSSSKTGLACVERAELIIPGAAPSAPAVKETPPSAPQPATPQEAAQKSADSPSSSESIEATCPICQAHLRLDPRKCSESNNLPTAEVVQPHQPANKPVAQPPTQSQPHPQPSAGQHNQPGDNHHLSFEERERQIAEGRKAHPIQLYPAQKPRLDYIRSGGATPPGKGPPNDKSPGHCHPDSFSE